MEEKAKGGFTNEPIKYLSVWTNLTVFLADTTVLTHEALPYGIYVMDRDRGVWVELCTGGNPHKTTLKLHPINHIFISNICCAFEFN